MTDHQPAAAADGPEARARRILDARFTTVRLREGYDEGAVDQFLDSLAAAARAGADLGPLVTAARFPVTRGRAGYDPAEVDAFIDALAAGPPAEGSGGTIEGGRPQPATSATSMMSTTSSTSSASSTGTAGPITEPQGPGIIPKPRGFLARFLGRG